MLHLCKREVLVEDIQTILRRDMPNLSRLTIRELRIIRDELEEARQRRVKG